MSFKAFGSLDHAAEHATANETDYKTMVGTSSSSANSFARSVDKRARASNMDLDVHIDKRVKVDASGPTILPGRNTIDDDVNHDPAQIFGQQAGRIDRVDEEDERFLGSGMTEVQTRALDYLDSADPNDNVPVVALNAADIRRMAAKLGKAVQKNEDMRARYPDDPSKFLESEVALDVEARGLSTISEYPDLLPVFLETECLATLASLLEHENSDIACTAIQVLEELTDEGTGSGSNDEGFCLALSKTRALKSLVQNLARLDEAITLEEDGIFSTLSVLESLITLDNTFKSYLVNRTKILDWLLARINKPDEVGFPMSRTRQYAAELLCILVQGSRDAISKLLDLEAIDAVLLLLAPFRKRDPDKGSIEEEFVANLFGLLNVLLSLPKGKDQFLEGEGVELLQRLLLDARRAETRLGALQSLEYACGSWFGGAVCCKVVEVGLLGSLFSLFMKKDDSQFVKPCLGIMASFFRVLNDGEAERIRVQQKFIENGHKKISRLLELRQRYSQRHDLCIEHLKSVGNVRKDGISSAEFDLENYLDRMENGLDVLQLIDTILTWLISEDGPSAKFLRQSKDASSLIENMKVILSELMQSLHIQQDPEAAEQYNIEDEAKQEYDMIEALLEGLTGK